MCLGTRGLYSALHLQIGKRPVSQSQGFQAPCCLPACSAHWEANTFVLSKANQQTLSWQTLSWQTLLCVQMSSKANQQTSRLASLGYAIKLETLFGLSQNAEALFFTHFYIRSPQGLTGNNEEVAKSNVDVFFPILAG